MTKINAKTIGITGGLGQLGFVVRARLEHHYGMTVKVIDRESFHKDDELSDFVSSCDYIIHLAGVIKSDSADLLKENLQIAQRLTASVEASQSDTAIIYASSVRIFDNNEYGRAKKAVGDSLRSFCSNNKLNYCEIVLPNLFGEFSKPYYNNVTGTFTHRIVNGETPDIHEPERELPLLSYLEAADLFADAILNNKTGTEKPDGHVITLQGLADRLTDMNADYSKGIFPDIRTTFDLHLFNALRTSSFPQMFPFPLIRHADERGSFFECIRERNGGQVSFSTTRPGVVRGDHFHFTKVERFLVLSGEAIIRVRKLYDDKVHEFHVSGEKPVFVDMPTFHTHNIENTGSSELTTLFWINEFFDPDNPDTYPIKV